MTYAFEYLFIPKIIDNSNKDEFSIESTILLDSFDSLQLSFSERHPSQSAHFDWEHFSIRKEMRAGVEYWLLTFPEPQSEPEARWGIIVHYKDQPYKYYTFEQGSNEQFFFCQVVGQQHRNCGGYPQELPEKEFIDLALQQAVDDIPARLRALLQ